MQVIPLEISRSHAVRETENSNFTDFLFHLLSDRVTNEQLEYERARAHGMELEDEHLLLRARFGHTKELSSYGFFFQKSLFLRQVQSRIEEMGLQVRVIQSEVETLLLLSYPGNLGELSAFLPRIEACINRLFDEHRALEIAIGCSRAHTKIVGLLACDREASLALRTAVDHGGRYFLQFDNLGILRLLYANDPQRESQLFVKEVFKDLLTDPSVQKNELLETLESYFRHQGNRREMARELYIHYNTVSYRLRRLGELTHMSLDLPEDRLQLHLALYLYKFRTSAAGQKREDWRAL
ncbi:MAG: helix-turn-helix domain-containing protein [Oscillospiraceae bacterium]|nr:helix-turn-helix domain-containing protein [Oscillospiraceae bacterium]